MASGTVGSIMFVMDLVDADNLPRDAKLSALKDAVNKAKRDLQKERLHKKCLIVPITMIPEIFVQKKSKWTGRQKNSITQ